MTSQDLTAKNAVVNQGANQDAKAGASGRVVRSRFARSLWSFLVVTGPGLIVMVADNDAGAVSTYTQAGAQYGTKLLWVLLLLLPVAYFIQEMVARLGIATGRGHAAMIYERFGKWWGRFSLADLLLVNFFTLVTEFAAIALAAQALGVPPLLAVPLAAAGLVLLVGTGSYRRWERMTLFLCLLDLLWIVLAFVVGPDFTAMGHDIVTPGLPPGGFSPDLVFLVIAIVGTTIAPWQLFFQQSCVADKRLRFADLTWARLDTFIGACLVVGLGVAMMLVGDALHRAGLAYTDPAQMAVMLQPVIGRVGKVLILLMMVNASLLGATAISLASTWAWGEVAQWRHSLEMKLSDASGFYGVYGLMVALAATVVLIPGVPLQSIIIGVQVLAGVMLPSAVIFLQLLLNDRALLGPEFVNKRWNNIVNWSVIAVLFALSFILAAQVIAPDLFPALST
ncbi:MAG TPA: Nramp family divalent metal transporter [Stellaceae bacterium]|nr:Nramp family divalent metal transporter [Stellaceae bacterium]